MGMKIIPITKKGKRIIPKREKCDCGKRVKNHHWFCDVCYGKNAIKKLKEKMKGGKKNV